MAERLITRDELSEAIGISKDSLRKYISRGKFLEVRKGHIDLEDEDNKVAIIAYASKKGIDCESTLYNKIEENNTIEAKELPENKPREKKSTSNLPQAELQKIKTEREVEKLDVETRLKKLELEKKKAKVLPLEFVIEWSALNIRGVFGETINFGNSIIEQLCNSLDADVKVKLEYKKKFKQGFNEILKDGIKKQKPEAITQAKEYSLLTKW